MLLLEQQQHRRCCFWSSCFWSSIVLVVAPKAALFWFWSFWWTWNIRASELEGSVDKNGEDSDWNAASVTQTVTVRRQTPPAVRQQPSRVKTSKFETCAMRAASPQCSRPWRAAGPTPGRKPGPASSSSGHPPACLPAPPPPTVGVLASTSPP